MTIGLRSGTIGLALVLSLAACAEEPGDDPGLGDDAMGEPTGAADAANPMDDAGTADADEVRVADIVSAPATFVGRTVTVVADVEEVLGPMVFALDEDAALEGGVDDDLIVLSDQASGLAAIDDQWLDNRVRVTGRVGTWTVVELEREVGWDLDPELEAEVEGREAVLIATSLERVEGEPR